MAPEKEALISQEFNKIACYQDKNGFTPEFSATCPHLGCIVQWNSAEKTFDCPCHGSRFTGEGKAICGHAITNLKPAKKETPAEA